jgi:DNA-binding XRE family transcriptional regulator
MTVSDCALFPLERPLGFARLHEVGARFPDPVAPEPRRGCSKGPITPTPAECRVLRNSLRWSREQLALEAGLTKRTVRDFETGIRTPHPRTLIAIRRAFRRAGAAPEPPNSLNAVW